MGIEKKSFTYNSADELQKLTKPEQQAYAQGFGSTYKQDINNIDEAKLAGEQSLANFRTQIRQTAVQKLQNPFNTFSVLGQNLQIPFMSNRKASSVTDEDRAAAKWTDNGLTGEEWLNSLDDQQRNAVVADIQKRYQNGEIDDNTSIESYVDMYKRNMASASTAANKKMLYDSTSQFADDVQQLMGSDAYNKLSQEDQDIVESAWKADSEHGIEAIVKAFTDNGFDSKYNINVGWNHGWQFKKPDQESYRPKKPEGRTPEEIQSDIDYIEQLESLATANGPSGNWFFTRPADNSERLAQLRVELNQAKTDWQNYEDALKAYDEHRGFDITEEADPDQMYQDPIGADIVRGTGETAINAMAESYHRLGGDVAGGFAYGAEQIEKALGIGNAVSQFFRRSEKGWRSMQNLAAQEKTAGSQKAMDSLRNVMSALGASEETINNASEAAKWIESNIVESTFSNIGRMLPSAIIDIMSGGATAAYDIYKAGAEAFGALGGRTLVQQFASGIQAAMSNPGFGATFTSEFFGNLADKIDNGQEPTPTDIAWMMMGSYVSSLIEYGGDDVASGFQAVLQNELGGLKGFIHSELGETVEEVTQTLTERVSENMAAALQGRFDEIHPVYSNDISDEALINLAEIWDTAWRTMVSTAGMSGIHYISSEVARGVYIRAARGQLTEEDMEIALQIQQLTQNAIETQEAHEQFEQSVNGEDPETARDKPMPAREVARDIENNEGTRIESNIQAEQAQTLEQVETDYYSELDDETLETLISNTEKNLSNAQEGTSYYRAQEQILNEARAVMENRRNGTTKTGRPEPTNEGTRIEQTIQSEPGQELPEQGRRPAETRPTDQRKTYDEMTLEELQAEKERQEENPEGFRPDRKQALDAAIRTAEARAKITAQTPEEYRRTLREQTRDIENNEDTTNPNNIQATYKVEEQGLPDVPRPQRETAPEQQELTAQRPEGEQLQNEEALNEEQKAEQEAIAEEDEGTAENPENYIPTEGRDVPPPQGETLTDEQGMPRTNEAAAAENEEAAAEQAVAPGEGQAAEATESIVQNPEEPAAPTTTPVEENNEVEPQSKDGNYEEEPTDEGELPHANTKIEQETEAEAKRSGFKAGKTNGDGRYDTGVHLVSTGGNISENKTKVLQIIDRFAKHFGFSVEAYNGDPLENGFYRQGGRIVSINLNTENPFQTVLSHEAFHMVKSLSPKSAQQIEAIFDRYAAGAGFDVDHEIDLIIAQYARAGKLDSLGTTDAERRAGAKEELIANSMYSLLSDEQTMRRIYAEDRNLFQRIMDWVSKVQQSIQEMLNDYADNTPEARMLRDQQGALEELHKAMLDALEEMKALDDAKKAAVPVHGNGEMTRTYERAVNKANSKAQITEANRYLAGSVLNQTGNEVNNENIEKLYYAAQEVVGGAQPYYAMKNNGLSTTGMNDDTRRAMQMMGEYFQSVLRSGSNEEYSALMNGVQDTKYSIDEKPATAEIWGKMADEEDRLNSRAQRIKLSDSRALEEDLAQSKDNETQYGDHKKFSLRVTDRNELNFLNNQKTETTYKTMQLIDGHLYPPMAAVVAGNMEDYSQLGEWEKATEHPELIKEGNKFKLNKGKGKGSLAAAYNPYMHSSNLMINDQFSGAWDRPNLVTVECEVPASEENSGYHAEYAKDSVGWHDWHTGTVAGQLHIKKGTKRQVFLSRWIKPVRIVPDSEVAQHYKELIQGTDIKIPDNVVSPSLLKALQDADVPIIETGRVKKKYSISTADRQRDAEYIKAVESGDEPKQQEMVKEAAVEAGYDTPKLYHGTGAFGFTEFNLEKGEGLIFATTDRSVAETYSGKTERSHISESVKFNPEELSGGELLATAQKHLKKYGNYHLMDELDKEQEADLARVSLRDYWRLAKEFVEDNKYAFNAEKMKLADKVVRALYDLSMARTDNELEDAWSRWDNGTWDLKWMDETTTDELLKAIGTHGLYVYKNRLSDFLYEGDIYCDDNAMYYAFDNQLKIELDAALHQGVYEMYGKTNKQLVIDCKGSNWNRIAAPEELHLSGEQKTRDIAAAAKAYGYESVLLKNLYDMGDYGYRAQSDIYIYLAPNQVKSADPVTYDDQGNVIPLSERFNAGSDDIRYSIDEDSARAGQEMWERQQEYTGGESQVLQKISGDLWKAIAQHKQQQKAENYGQWKAHVAEMARNIKEETNSSVFTEKQLEDRLTAILEEHEKMPHATREEAEHAINNTLVELQALYQEALSDQLMDEHYKEVKSALKNGIYINPDQVKELGGAAELRDFRNALSGFCRVYTSEKAANAARAMHLDGAGWEELQSIDPDVFNPDTHWLERAQALRDFVDLHTDSTMRDDPMTRDYIRSQALETLAEYYIGSIEKDATKRTRDALKKANSKVSSLKNQLEKEMKAQADLADQLKAEKKASYEKLNQVQNEAFGDRTKLNQQMQEAQAKTKATNEELEAVTKERDKLKYELEDADERVHYLENTISLLKNQNKQNQEAAVKSDRSKRAIKARARQNIKRLEMKMRRMLEKPNNTTYVPQDMIRKLLDMVEAIQKADTRKAAQVTDKWLKAVRELRDDTNNLLKDAYYDGFVKQMEEVADIVKDRPLNKLYTDELEYVSNVMTQALHQIETARQMIGWKKNTDALVEAQNWVETMKAKKPQPTGGIGKVVNNLATEHLTPQRELDRLAGYRKDNAVYRQKEGLSEGQRVTNKVKMDQTRNFEELITGKNAQNFKKWAGKKADVIDTGIQGSRHGTFKMTHDFLTTLYMHSLNQQNMDGMKNGLTVPDYVLWKEGKRKEAWDRAERMHISAEDMQRLMGMVTEYDKQWAEAWKKNQSYITPKLNDVAMQLNGWHKFTVENYFPIRRDGNYLATDFDSIMLDDRIANMGFQKARKNATNPMMLESMLDVVNRTINGTSLYAGMLIPVTNFNKVFNMSLPDYEDSPKAALRRVWGNKEMEYIERMMKDLQQAGIRADESIFDKVRSKAAPAALGANPTVVIKQAASYPTAAAVLGWKPLMQQLAKPRKFDQKITDKYTSAYWERSDANIQAMNANVQSGGIDRTSSVLNKPIGAMDRATVRMIWGACEYAVEKEQPKLKRGSEEYYEAVARKYEECLEMTQPEYGTMQRPHIMRSNNTLQKAMTMYKTQAFQNFNIVYDAVQDVRTQAQMYKKNQSKENKAELDRAKTKLARAVSSQIVSATVLAVMTAVGKALLHKPEPYQDDKGEVTAASAAYQMSKDAISSMAGMVTGGSELFDLITGIMEGKAPYDIDASAISMINDLYQSIYKLGNAATIIGDGSLSWDKKLEKGGKAVDNFLKSAGALLGIPYNNMRNIGTSVYKYADDILSGRGLEGLTTGDVTLTTAARYMGEALQRGDKDAYVRLYNRLLKQGKTNSQINSAMKSWMKTSDPRIQQAATAIDSGDIDTYNMLINQMTDAGYGMANVVTAIEAVRKAGAESAEGGAQTEQTEYAPMNYDQIIEAQENADASAYTYAQMNQLLDSGNTRAALQVQKALFKSKGTTAVKSALTSYWKPKYQEAYQNRNRTELNRITRLLKTMGYSDQSINKWKNVESTTTNTSSKKTGFGSGTFGSSFGKKSSSKKSSSRFGRRF